MVDRCTNPGATSFRRYGDRGITVHQPWIGRGGFQVFLADMGLRPEGLTLDRIDNDGNYEPGNCRWATLSEQQRNKTRRVGTHCRRGHIYAITGLYYNKNGTYQCKACSLRRASEARARLRANKV